MDGDANGRISAELSNWTGKAYRIPWKRLGECAGRKELEGPGVYILLSRGDDDGSYAYVGESESVFARLMQHCDAKDFWTECIVFVSKDRKLNKAHVKFLEHTLYISAREVARYRLKNASVPTRSRLSEPEEAEMTEFFENIKLITNALGCKIFEPVVAHRPAAVFAISTKGLTAHGIVTNEGFVVLRGSRFVRELVPSARRLAYCTSLRERLLADGSLCEAEGAITAARDILFPTPSAAACQVMGRPANGLIEWKLPDGTPLKATR